MKKIAVLFMLLLFFQLSSKNIVREADTKNAGRDDEKNIGLEIMEFEDKSGKFPREILSEAAEYLSGAIRSYKKFSRVFMEYHSIYVKHHKTLRTTIGLSGRKKYVITSEFIFGEEKVAKATFDGSEKSLREALDSIAAQIAGATKEEVKKASEKKAQESKINGEYWLDRQENRRIGGLVWSARSRKEMNLNDAKLYCEYISEGGFNDWRLPNIDELRTLVINYSGTETGGSCKISVKAGKLALSDRTDACNGSDWGNYSKLNDNDWLWSDSTTSDDTGSVWVVGFMNGIIGSRNKSNVYYVRCVR